MIREVRRIRLQISVPLWLKMRCFHLYSGTDSERNPKSIQLYRVRQIGHDLTVEPLPESSESELQTASPQRISLHKPAI
jgi:hypothetical protein